MSQQWILNNGGVVVNYKEVYCYNCCIGVGDYNVTHIEELNKTLVAQLGINWYIPNDYKRTHIGLDLGALKFAPYCNIRFDGALFLTSNSNHNAQLDGNLITLSFIILLTFAKCWIGF